MPTEIAYSTPRQQAEAHLRNQVQRVLRAYDGRLEDFVKKVTEKARARRQQKTEDHQREG
jgi:hypothetical protein